MSGLLLVRDAMAKNVKTVRVDDTVLDAVKKMNKFRIGSMVVLSGDRPVGIITERDILQRIVEPFLDPMVVKAREIMSAPLTTIGPEAPLEEAARLMVRLGIKKLPVVEGGKLVGMITTSDLVRASPIQVSIIEELLKVRTK
jgi:CBS domain-containing protein